MRSSNCVFRQKPWFDRFEILMAAGVSILASSVLLLLVPSVGTVSSSRTAGACLVLHTAYQAQWLTPRMRCRRPTCAGRRSTATECRIRRLKLQPQTHLHGAGRTVLARQNSEAGPRLQRERRIDKFDSVEHVDEVAGEDGGDAIIDLRLLA
jgi:hypothetical protein